MTAVSAAWNDEEWCEPFGDLTPEGRTIRAAAQAEIFPTGLQAVADMLPEMGSLDELYGLLSWIDDAQLWPPYTAKGGSDMADLIGATEAARLLGVNRGTVHRWVQSGQLEVAQRLDSGIVLFDRATIEQRAQQPA